MTDLFVLTADADALAVMNAVLARPVELGIRPITFKVDRHFGRDPGLVKDGPELVRMKAPKREFAKTILLWDYAGSGWERRYTPAQSEDRVQARLDGVTWKNHSRAFVLVPELEAWLCQDEAALERFTGVGTSSLSLLADPKESIERVFYSRFLRNPRTQGFRTNRPVCGPDALAKRSVL